MSSFPRISVAILLLVLPISAGFSAPSSQQSVIAKEGVVEVSPADAKMNAAIEEARRRLPEFVKIVRKPPPGATDIAFKFPLDGKEHIWVDTVSVKGKKLVGKLANKPTNPQYRLGQKVVVPFGTISDWGYRDADGRMQGNFTTRVLLDMIDPEEAAAIRAEFKW